VTIALIGTFVKNRESRPYKVGSAASKQCN
jgi:hypothetical protein